MLRFNKTRAYTNMIAFIFLLLINGFASYIGINNQTTGAIGERFPIYFIPASYVFNIWILIYVLLFCFTIFQNLRSQKKNPFIYQVGYWFAFSSILNVVWLIFWHYDYFVLSFFTMLALLLVLTIIYSNLYHSDSKAYLEDKLFIKIPFSIYLAWICVATISNLNVMLYTLEWDWLGISLESWTILMLVLGTLLAAIVTLIYNDIFFSLVFIWAYLGISYRFSTVTIIQKAGWIMSGILVLIIIVTLVKKRRRKSLYY